MSTTVTYKGSTLTTVENATKTLATSGKYMEGDVIITDVTSGGGEVTVDKSKGVIFIDYDGTYVDYWNPEDVASKTALPSNPSHNGLTAQGWNWTLSRIQAQILAYPDAPVWVGQMYITSSGATEIHISLDNTDLLSPYLKIAVNGTVTVNWGDGTSTNTVTGTSLTRSTYTLHTYATTGDYVISISVTDGEFSFYNKFILCNTNDSDQQAYRYSPYIDAVYIGSGMTRIGNYAFNDCYSLQPITIPSSVTSIGNYVFNNCYSLQSITIPSEVTSIGTYAFQICNSLQSITIPSGVTSIEMYAFNDCNSLQSITIPSSVTSIGTYAFYNCHSLKSITIPSGVTSIESRTFQSCNSLHSLTISSGVTSIETYAFQSCYSLQSITIPSSVTSIGTFAFSYLYPMHEYHLLPTTPPRLANKNAFNGIASDCVIYVPSASLEAYQTATNWSNYASKMVGE